MSIVTAETAETHELLTLARRALGMATLEDILGVGRAAAYRMCRSPRLEGQWSLNVLDRAKDLLGELTAQGHQELAWRMCAMLAEACGCEARPVVTVEPDQGSADAEGLDDFQALARFDAARRSGASLVDLRRLVVELEQELLQTVTAQARELGAGDGKISSAGGVRAGRARRLRPE